MDDSLKILVVDDEEMILTIVSEYLETTTPHKILTAANGLEAINLLENEGIDCCITDLNMPQMGGLELAQHIQAKDASVPVVVMTGYPSMDNAIRTIKNGVADFLIKPIKMDQLRLTIERVTRERRLLLNNLLLKEEAKKATQLLHINKELQQKIKDVETVNLIFRQLDQATTSKDLFSILVKLSGQVTNCDETHLCIHNSEMSKPVVVASQMHTKKAKGLNGDDVYNRISRKAVSEGMPLLVNSKNGDGNVMAIPLKIKSRVFGTLVSINRNGQGAFSDKDLYYMNFLAEKASFLIENLALYENIYENVFSTLFAFVEAIEAKDPYTKQHSSRVTLYAVIIAKELGCSHDEIEVLNVAGNLHDIGKIGIPDSILLKPGRLTEEEYEIIKKHPTIGGNIMDHFNMWSYEKEIITHHHERWDGNGYPDRLKGEETPFLSRILAVADVFDAMASDRSYRKKMPDDKVARVISENSGSQFDPNIVEAFVKLHKNGKISSDIKSDI